MKNKKNQKAKRSRWWLLTWWRLRSGKNEKGRKEKWAWRSMEEKWVKRWRLRREEEVKRETKEKERGSDIHGHVIDESLGCENMLAMRACKCHEEHNREAILELRFSPSNLNLLYFIFILFLASCISKAWASPIRAWKALQKHASRMPQPRSVCLWGVLLF